MIVRVRIWYQERSLRERRLLLLTAAIALPLLAWLISIPVTRANDAALRQHLEAVDRNGRVHTLADAARAGPGKTGQTDAANLDLVVMETAAQAGISLSGTNPAAANSLEVQASGTSATAAIQWLRGLEARGVQVNELRMAPAADRTITMSARLVRRS